MHSFFEFILSLSIESLIQYRHFSYIHKSLNNAKEFKANVHELPVWISFLSLAGTLNISVEDILNLHPLEDVFKKIDLFFKKELHHFNQSADELLTLLIEEKGELEDPEGVIGRLHLILYVRETLYGSDYLSYLLTACIAALTMPALKLSSKKNVLMLQKSEEKLNILSLPTQTISTKDVIQVLQRKADRDDNPLSVPKEAKHFVEEDKKKAEERLCYVNKIVDLYLQMCRTVKDIGEYKALYLKDCVCLEKFILAEMRERPMLAALYLKEPDILDFPQIMLDWNNPNTLIRKALKSSSPLKTALLNLNYIYMILANPLFNKEKVKVTQITISSLNPLSLFFKYYFNENPKKNAGTLSVTRGPRPHSGSEHM